MVNIIAGDSECAWRERREWGFGGGGERKRHQSPMENNLLRSEMRQLRGKDQKEKKRKKK